MTSENVFEMCNMVLYFFDVKEFDFYFKRAVCKYMVRTFRVRSYKQTMKSIYGVKIVI